MNLKYIIPNLCFKMLKVMIYKRSKNMWILNHNNPGVW